MYNLKSRFAILFFTYIDISRTDIKFKKIEINNSLW